MSRSSIHESVRILTIFPHSNSILWRGGEPHPSAHICSTNYSLRLYNNSSPCMCPTLQGSIIGVRVVNSRPMGQGSENVKGPLNVWKKRDVYYNYT